jgi:hypothetical protein
MISGTAASKDAFVTMRYSIRKRYRNQQGTAG